MEGLLHQRAQPGHRPYHPAERRPRTDAGRQQRRPGPRVRRPHPSGCVSSLNRINLGGNYTWSEIIGNITGETTGSGVVTETADHFQPEYFGFAQNNPIGFLSTDQTHKLRAWAAVDFPTFLGNFNFSVLQSFDTGARTRCPASIDIRTTRTTTARRPRPVPSRLAARPAA